MNAELEVLVLKLEAASDPAAAEEPLETSKSGKKQQHTITFTVVFNVWGI